MALANARVLQLAALLLSRCSFLGVNAKMDDETRQKREEASMMKALHNCPLCRDKEPCLLDCRFAQKRSWKECLEECLKDSPMVRDLMIEMSEVSKTKHTEEVTTSATPSEELGAEPARQEGSILIGEHQPLRRYHSEEV
eukprot:gnl/MRDRNA2_/MRDRNA2_121160_c0_seq1.p1 gnl/MRDRNA2_/MRDRNA2_121160_c0~~gnl/MRDRNA2_/MRDRNA2_121160_c0_seq1.p1  ORF type:complete len:140 (-),score=32.32 gnl/MRDRNA2_/MRDRNA2_121160_c0_seq1:98-517(-)